MGGRLHNQIEDSYTYAQGYELGKVEPDGDELLCRLSSQLSEEYCVASGPSCQKRGEGLEHLPNLQLN